MERIEFKGSFKTSLVLENFETWHLGLISLTLQALNEGLIKIGFGKNRGFGDVFSKSYEPQSLSWRDGLKSARERFGELAHLSRMKKVPDTACIPTITYVKSLNQSKKKTSLCSLAEYIMKNQWKSIASKAIETLAGLTEIIQ